MSDVLILFIGSSVFRDDRMGLIVGERLKDKLIKLGCNVEVLEESGLKIIDILSGWEKVIVIDSVKTGRHRVGDVFKIDLNEFDSVKSVSPHYTGLPEALELLRDLDLAPPKDVQIIGIEVYDPYTIDTKLSNGLAGKVDDIANAVYNIIIESLKD